MSNFLFDPEYRVGPALTGQSSNLLLRLRSAFLFIITIYNALRLRCFLCKKEERTVKIRDVKVEEISFSVTTFSGGDLEIVAPDLIGHNEEFYFVFDYEEHEYRLKVTEALHEDKHQGDHLIVEGIKGRDRWHFRIPKRVKRLAEEHRRRRLISSSA